MSKRNLCSYLDVFYAWRYVSKSVPILASVAHSLIASWNYILNSNKLPIYEVNFSYLLFHPIINFDKNFLGHSINYLNPLPPTLLKIFFSTTFPLYILIYIDGSFLLYLAGILIPDLYISFTNNLSLIVSSYTPIILLTLNLFNSPPLYYPISFLLLLIHSQL